MRRIWKRLIDLSIERVIGVNDTPKRIAAGVFLGFIVGFTPTIGIQIALYLLLATLFRVNKVSGIPPLFISNPVTAVPLYYSAWVVGRTLLGRSDTSPSETLLSLKLDLFDMNTYQTFIQQSMTLSFWQKVGTELLTIGAELWLGALVLGVLSGSIGYFVTLRAIHWYRCRLERLSPNPSSANPSPPITTHSQSKPPA